MPQRRQASSGAISSSGWRGCLRRARSLAFSAFAWAYVLAQIPGGALLDRFGTKRIYAGAIALWSVFTALQGTVGFLFGLPIVATLFAMRFLVGLAATMVEDHAGRAIVEP